MPDPNQVDLGRAYLTRQRLLSTELELPLDFTSHPTTIGDASEANWRRMLTSFLPGRYEVGPVFALDAAGAQSQQIDLAIYDRQYSPLWLQVGASRIVPAESIYAVFEVKPEVNAGYLRYAAEKAASVRSLGRTSGRIVDIYGTQPGPRPETRPILGGILALRSGWSSGLSGTTGRRNLGLHQGLGHLDLGIALEDCAFDHIPSSANLELLTPGLEFSRPGIQLIYFAMHLFRRLQAIGTALAVDLDIYEAALEAVDVSQYSDEDLAPA
jgi:hypothetical protein